MAENDFLKQQQAALERMREMNSRSQFTGGGHRMPPSPEFVRVQGENRNHTANTARPNRTQEEEARRPAEDVHKEKKEDTKKDGIFSFLEGIDIPFLNRLKTDTDMTLVIGIALILYSEKADKLLLFALLYILM